MEGIIIDDITQKDRSELIFVLTFNNKLPEGYSKLSNHFAGHGISLVPIEFDQYMEFFKSFNHINLLVMENGFQQKKWFRKYFRGHFEFAVKNKVLTLHHISSFSEVRFRNGYERFYNYHHYKLPLKTHELVDDIAQKYYTKKHGYQKWPGGRRGKVPDIVA